jgi:Tol biopolymer transport system component
MNAHLGSIAAKTIVRRLGTALVLLALVWLGGPHIGALAAVPGLSREAPRPATLARPDSATRVGMSESYGKPPLYFEANRGQTDPQVKFLVRGLRQTLFLTSTEAVLVLTERKPSAPEPAVHGRPEPRGPAAGTVLRMMFAGANPTPRVMGLEKLPGKANYFLGNDPAKWRTNVPTYAKVRYEEVYPGIDLLYYGTHRHLEYDLVVRAGADPRRIVLSVEGADRLEVDARGDLVLHTAAGPIRQRKPDIYQEVGGVRREIPGGYVLTATHQVRFRVAAYDVSRPLVIDPVLYSYSTYLGGGSVDHGEGIAVDGAGNAYVTGSTGSLNFPTTAGAFQTTLGGGFCCNAFVTKLNPDGSALVYSTYLGGSRFDQGSAIAVDAAGNAYVTGGTQSPNFPTTAGAFQTTLGGGAGAFVTKLNPDGSALVYSTYLGGSGRDSGSGIAVNAAGNAYVTGTTLSPNFPTTAGAFQTTLGGGSCCNAFVTKLNPDGSALVYSTYLGGSSQDMGIGIAVDAAGNAYVTGLTLSADFPVTAAAFQTTFGGIQDAFVTKLNSEGSALVYSTYLGGNGLDQGNGIAVNTAGNAYVTGRASSDNFPTRGEVQGPLCNGAFVTKLNPDGSALVYSTYLGGSPNSPTTGLGTGGNGIAVDAAGNAYVTGVTESSDFPTSEWAFQPVSGGSSSDAFVTKLIQIDE